MECNVPGLHGNSELVDPMLRALDQLRLAHDAAIDQNNDNIACGLLEIIQELATQIDDVNQKAPNLKIIGVA